MKKYFLTMLIGLLPLVGWANDPLPEISLTKDYTDYNGDETIQPILTRDCRKAGAKIVEVWYLGVNGDEDPVQTFDFEEFDEEYDPIPVRDAGIYKVVATYSYERPRAPQNNDTAIDGDPTTGGDDEGDGEEVNEGPVELLYEVRAATLVAEPADITRVYGDDMTDIPMEYAVRDTEYKKGDLPSDFEVKGGTVAISNIKTNVGSLPYWSGDVEGYVYLYDKVNEVESTNYVVTVTGTAAIKTIKATVEVSVVDLTKTYGQCDDEAVIDGDAEDLYVYEGFKFDDDKSVIKGIDEDHPSWFRVEKGEDVNEEGYQLGVNVEGLTADNYTITAANEQGKLYINAKSIEADGVVITKKFFVDGEEAAYTEAEDGTIDVEGFTYGKVLTWTVSIVDNNVCTTISETGKRELNDNDVDKPECVDGDCGDDDLEICGKGNYKDCIPFRVPDPDPACLDITAYIVTTDIPETTGRVATADNNAEPTNDQQGDDVDDDCTPITLGETFEVAYDITGWQKEENFSDALAAVLSYEIKDAEGNTVTDITAVGEYTIEVIVPEQLPAELSNYKVCEVEGTCLTVEPICINDPNGAGVAAIEITMPEVDGEPMDCFPFTGSEIKPEITVTFNGETLDPETDYDVEYSNNIHATKYEEGKDPELAKITVTGKGNYDCEVEAEFCIAPSTATVYVDAINFDVYEEVINPETGETVKQYQNGKFYAQYETENNITLGYEGITAEELEALGLEIKGKRFGGETVGFYSVAIFAGDEQLTPGKLKYEGEEAIETSTLTEGEKTFGDITITFIPGLYEIKKNSEPLNYKWDTKQVYGKLRLDLTRMKDPTYIEDLKAEYREFFKGATYHGLDNDAKALIDKNIINIDAITMADIHVSPVVDGVVGDEYTIEQFAALVKRTHGNIPVGKYFVNITGATSVNYQLGTVTMNVEVTPRPIGIEFSDQTSGKHGSFNADAVTYTIVEVPDVDIQGLATGDNDATDLNIKAKLDGENITLDEEAFFDDTKVSGVYKYIGMNYEPIVTDGKYIIDDEPLHFIIHRTARNINWIDKEQTEETDLAISTWNDTEDRIIAFDGETVETVYFRTFNAAKVADDNLEQLFPDPELEPITYKDKDGNVVDENGGFWLYSNKWYSMVLPFDIYVYEFGTHPVFGHAVINVLDEKNADPLKMQFKLQEVGIIRANTPFIFKVGDKGDPDTYLATTGEGEDEMATTPIANLDELTFTNKKIVKPANFDEIYVEDDSKLRFYGSYSGKGCLKDYEYYFSIAPMLESFDGYYFGSDDNTSWLYPSTCYGVDGNHAAGARQLIVQEEDGSFTAIKSIENVTYTNNAEGWFTTNGMKLNAQPTQRGIYIHNGKKVVVK